MLKKLKSQKLHHYPDRRRYQNDFSMEMVIVTPSIVQRSTSEQLIYIYECPFWCFKCPLFLVPPHFKMCSATSGYLQLIELNQRPTLSCLSKPEIPICFNINMCVYKLITHQQVFNDQLRQFEQLDEISINGAEFLQKQIDVFQILPRGYKCSPQDLKCLFLGQGIFH